MAIMEIQSKTQRNDNDSQIAKCLATFIARALLELCNTRRVGEFFHQRVVSFSHVWVIALQNGFLRSIETMPTFKITRQVGNPDFACDIHAELAIMCLVSYYVASTVAIIRKYQNDNIRLTT
ncbi:hypothetical protein TNCV_5096001 [Trichonephila clavipes]|nr:hypothetical protein TNCV_5096001 [Trichonephila clavipes]